MKTLLLAMFLLSLSVPVGAGFSEITIDEHGEIIKVMPLDNDGKPYFTEREIRKFFALRTSLAKMEAARKAMAMFIGHKVSEVETCLKGDQFCWTDIIMHGPHVDKFVP